MPYANNHGVRIYYELEGKGYPLVLAHGLSGNLNHWRKENYANTLAKNFQLILFDARGHGKSDKPHEISDYGLNMVEDIIAVLDHLGITKAHYYGYSMGTRIGFRAALYHANRFHAFVLGGANPYRNQAEIEVEKELLASMQLLADDPQAFAAQMEKAMHHPLPPEDKKTMLDNDGTALIAIVKAIGQLAPLSEHQLAGISNPCLLYCGDRDPRYAGAKKCAGFLANARFISLPGFDHSVQAHSDLILPHVTAFLSETTKT